MQLKRRFLSSFPVTYKQFCKYTRQGTVAVSWLMFWYDMSSHFFPRVGRRKPAKKEIDFLWRPFSRPRGCSLLFVIYCPLFVQSPSSDLPSSSIYQNNCTDTDCNGKLQAGKGNCATLVMDFDDISDSWNGLFSNACNASKPGWMRKCFI